MLKITSQLSIQVGPNYAEEAGVSIRHQIATLTNLALRFPFHLCCVFLSLYTVLKLCTAVGACVPVCACTHKCASRAVSVFVAY